MDKAPEITYDLSLLERSFRAWESSPALREFYAELYEAVGECCSEGPTLEIGSGIGVSRDFIDGVVTSDVVQTPYVDRQMSAYEIKLPDSGYWTNVFAIDVLHHLMTPLRFLQSAANALAHDGRLILVEPAATMGGRLFYRLFHPEPAAPRQINAPFEFNPNAPDGGFANMGMGVALFRDHLEEVQSLLTGMGLICESVAYRDLLAYPATGGYSKPQLLPSGCIRALLCMEKRLPQALLRCFGLRMQIVLRKYSS